MNSEMILVAAQEGFDIYESVEDGSYSAMYKDRIYVTGWTQDEAVIEAKELIKRQVLGIKTLIRHALNVKG